MNYIKLDSKYNKRKFVNYLSCKSIDDYQNFSTIKGWIVTGFVAEYMKCAT